MRWRPLVRTLRLNAVRSALTTIVVACLVNYGFNVDEKIVDAIIGAGVVVVLVSAGMDARKKKSMDDSTSASDRAL